MYRTNGRSTILAVVVFAATIEGCGGGSGSPSPTPTRRPSSPVPSASVPSPTAIDDGATATIRFASGLSTGAKAVTVSFPKAPVATATLTPGCIASVSCAVTVPAPIGQQTFTVDAYASTTATGTALGIATPSASFFANANTAVIANLEGILASYTLSLQPPGLTAQIASTEPIVVSPEDAAGVPIATPFLTNAGRPAAFTFVQTATNGATTTLGSFDVADLPTATISYSGLQPNPSLLTATIGGYPNVSIPIPVAVASGTVGYALQTGGVYKRPNDYTPTYAFPTGSSTITREYQLYGSQLAFDPTGTLWVAGGDHFAPIRGVTTSGSSVGPITNVPQLAQLLAFDTTGRLYTISSDETTIDIYTIGANDAATPVRNIVPSGGSCLYGAVDGAQNLYVACASGLSEFGPSGGNGNVQPIATNTIATGPVAVDGAGDVYASYCVHVGSCVLGMWPHGTFGAGAPPSSLPEPTDGLNDEQLLSVAVDVAGNVYELSDSAPFFDSAILWYFPKGSTTPRVLDGQNTTDAVATPLR